jgi:hypothetical protein
MASVNLLLLVYYLVFFFYSILWCSWIGHDPSDNWAKRIQTSFYIFGYLLEINIKSENSFSKMVIW